MKAELYGNGILVTGNTFPYRSDLKSLGGTWNKKQQGWLFPKSALKDVEELVNNKSPASSPVKTNNTYNSGNYRQEFERLYAKMDRLEQLLLQITHPLTEEDEDEPPVKRLLPKS